MSNINAGLVDEIYSLQSSSTSASPVTLVSADSNRRPFVCYARAAGGGSTIKIGNMVIHDDGDTTYSGLCVGNKGDAVTHEGSGTSYLVTCGYLSKTVGNPSSQVKDS